ncbi:MAG: hypothetical protein WD226_08865 [Planctomycetota bacterium]
MQHIRTTTARAGFTLVEQMIVLALFVTVFLSGLALIESGRKFSSTTLGIANVEDLSQQMLHKLERELSNARGAEPIAVLSVPLAGAESGTLLVDSTLGFPPAGTLLLARGTAREERIQYAYLDPNQIAFSNLGRGEQCTQPASHDASDPVLWSGLAEPLDNQTNPAANMFDGTARDGNGQVFFRGDGTGFAYRVPVVPPGGNSMLNGDELFWGAEIPGTGATTNGWATLYFEPRETISEAEVDQDLNGDRDKTDTFDVGQLRRRQWSATDPQNIHSDVAMGPTALLQERCNYGGDLDGDGFDDPMFLWNPRTNELAVRLFLLGRSKTNTNLVRQAQTVMFLRNEPEQLQN